MGYVLLGHSRTRLFGERRLLALLRQSTWALLGNTAVCWQLILSSDRRDLSLSAKRPAASLQHRRRHGHLSTDVVVSDSLAFDRPLGNPSMVRMPAGQKTVSKRPSANPSHWMSNFSCYARKGEFSRHRGLGRGRTPWSRKAFRQARAWPAPLP